MQRLVVLMALAGAFLLAAAAWLADASGADGGHGILFVRWPHGHGRGRPQIYVWRRGAGSRRMSPSSSATDYPAWAPDGKLVAFAGFRGSRDQSAPFDIWIMRPDGTHLSRVTNEAARRSGLRRAVEPSWSPDGRRIVFVRQFSDRPDRLAVVSLAGRRERALPVRGDTPAWGRPGITYAGRGGIMLLDPGSGHSAVFAALRERVIALAWSSRGELAALEGDLGERIVVYSRDGRILRVFGAPSPAAGTCGLSWSPDGRRLLVRVENTPCSGTGCPGAAGRNAALLRASGR